MINSIANSELHQVTEFELNDTINKVNTNESIESMKDIMLKMSNMMGKMSTNMVEMSTEIEILTNQVSILRKERDETFSENKQLKSENKQLKEEAKVMLQLKTSEKDEKLKTCRKKYSNLCLSIQNDPVLWLPQRIIKLLINNKNKNNAVKAINKQYVFIDRKVPKFD